MDDALDQQKADIVHPDNLVNRVLQDRYRIVRLIGVGGMARVYEGLHIDLEQPVAIKILEGGDGSAQDRFDREIKVLAAVEHPHIVAVRASGRTSDGLRFLVMDLVRGTSLSAKIKNEGPLTAQQAQKIFSQICQGLSYAHERNIVHRDLKPANVMLTADGGDVKLLDFGIAKLVDDRGAPQAQHLTATGTPIGSPEYMSPEQCQGQSVDARTDIYSLGCLMFECLTGEPPFTGDSAFVVMSRHLHDEMPASPALDALPKMKAIIARCLAKHPDDRWRSAAEIAAQLDLAERSDSVVDKRTSFFLYPGVDSSGGRIKGVILVGGMLAVLGTGALFYLGFKQNERVHSGVSNDAYCTIGGVTYSLDTAEVGNTAKQRWRDRLDLQAAYLRAWAAYNRKNPRAKPNEVMDVYNTLLTLYEKQQLPITPAELKKLEQESLAFAASVREPRRPQERWTRHFLYGAILNQTGDYKKGELELLQSLKYASADPNSARLREKQTWYTLFVIYEAHDRLNEALSAILRAIALTHEHDGTLGQHYYELASIYERMGQRSKAVEAVRQSVYELRRAPPPEYKDGIQVHSHWLSSRASLLAVFGQYDEARQVDAEALACLSADGNYRFNPGTPVVLYKQLGGNPFVPYVEFLERQKADEPFVIDTFVNWCSHPELAGNPVILDYFKQLLEKRKSPEAQSAALLLGGMANYDRDKCDLAEESFRAAAERTANVSSQQARHVRIMALTALLLLGYPSNNLQMGEEAFEQLKLMKIDNPDLQITQQEAYPLMAHIYIKLGKLDKARMVLEEAKKLRNSDQVFWPSYVLEMGCLSRARGDYNAGLVYYAVILDWLKKSGPNPIFEARANEGTGSCLAAQGKTGEAEKYLLLALKGFQKCRDRGGAGETLQALIDLAVASGDKTNELAYRKELLKLGPAPSEQSKSPG